MGTAGDPIKQETESREGVIKEDTMIKVLPDSEGNILVLKALGKLTDQDYKEALIPRLESIIHEHGRARLLLDLCD